MKLTLSSAQARALILGVAIGGGIGFLCGKRGSSAPNATGGDDVGNAPAHASSRTANPGNLAAAANASLPDGKRDSKTGAPISAKLQRLEAIMKSENPLDRDRALVAFIDQLAPGEFEEAITHFRSLGMTGKRLAEYSMLLTGWAKVDPEAALTFANTKIGSTYATSKILAALAVSDPEGAIRWAEANHSGTTANPYLAGIIRTLSASDPAQATALLSTMPFSKDRGKALDAMLPQYLAKGADATHAWIATLPPGSLRDSATKDAAEKLAETNPKATADWLLANRTEATARSFDNVLGTWALMDAPGALAYFEGLPPGDDRVNALRGIVGSMASQDPVAAAELLKRYPADVTDSTLQGFVKNSTTSNPAMALDYIGQISDPKTQEQQYRKSLDAWLATDPAAAQAWMQQNTLPPKVVDHYNKP